ncbi:MAG: hypothetical protein ACKVRO_12355 [Micropepsaceae bacterium]
MFHALRFQDFDFEGEFASCRSRRWGGAQQRWIPHGMPRINPALGRAIFFLYGVNPKTGATDGPVATGFFVGYRVRLDHLSPEVVHIYAVTCQHVAPDGASIIRINTKGGGNREIPLEPHEWEFVKSGADVAAVDVTDHLVAGDSVEWIPTSWFLSKGQIEQSSIWVGEDGFMLGLLTDVHSHRNEVVGRFGNLGMVADDGCLIKQPNGNQRPAHLFDIRSRTGFSGSPVFIYRTPSADLRHISYGIRPRTTKEPEGVFRNARLPFGNQEHTFEIDIDDNIFLLLLGVHVGQFREDLKAQRKVEPQAVRPIVEGDVLTIQSGMTVVAPCWDIEAVLNLKVFQDMRQKRHDKADAERRREPIGQSAAAEKGGRQEAPPNPEHKEAFRSLVGAAAKTKKQDD